jgi:zinc transport system permease protein
MLDDFLVRAALAGLGVGLAAGPLGCFVVWRRMAYFGDATAHAAILGVALALFFNVSVFAGVLVISILVASLVSTLSGRGLGIDTVLGVLARFGGGFGGCVFSRRRAGRPDGLSVW